MKRLITIIALTLSVNAMAQFDVFSNMAPKDLKSKKTETVKPAVNKPDKPNKTDAQGRKQGEWAKKYENGQYIYIATFKDDKPVGTVTRYNENGKKSSELTYGANGRVDAIYYHDNGRIASKGAYINKIRIGEWCYYDEDKRIVARENFKDGKLNGTVFTYYENGQVSDESNYTEGVLNGPWIQYFQNGKRRLDARYVNGVLNGRYRFWDDGGSLSVDGQYNMGVQIGDWKIYEDENGKTFFVMEYDNNGTLLNEDEVQRRMSSKLEMHEKTRQNIVDPEDFVTHPEDYNPSMQNFMGY